MDLDKKEEVVEQEKEVEQVVEIENQSEGKQNVYKKSKIGLLVLLIIASMIGGYSLINKINLMIVAKNNQGTVAVDPTNTNPNQKPPDNTNPDPSSTSDPLKNPTPTGKVIYKIGTESITDTNLAEELNKIIPPDFETRMTGIPEKDQKVYRDQFQTDALKNLFNLTYIKLYIKDQKINITDADLAKTRKDLTDMMQKIHESQNTGKPFNLEERLRQYNIDAKTFTQDIYNQTVYRIATTPFLDKITATEQEAKDFFKKHPELYNEPAKADLKHILLTSEAEADAVIAELNKGADFTTLAKAKSKDPQVQSNGGALGWISNDRARVPSEILNVIFAPQVKINTPLKIMVDTQWYVMIVSGIQNEVVKSYTELTDKAMYDVKEEKRKIALEDFLKKLETKYGKPVPQQ